MIVQLCPDAVGHEILPTLPSPDTGHTSVEKDHDSSIVDDPAPVNDASEGGSNNDDSAKSLYVWDKDCVLLLLDKYREHEDQFKSGVKRHSKIWDDIAQSIGAVNPKYAVTGAQCKTKLSGLKRTYKQIRDYNSVSGNHRRTWQFYQIMDDMFNDKGWANPKTTATEGSCKIDSPKETNDGKSLPKKRSSSVILENYLSEIRQQRKEAEEAKKARREEKEAYKKNMLQELKEQRERQHKEKMCLLQKLLSK